jgi:Ca2+-binding EF-hand superfamily protein
MSSKATQDDKLRLAFQIYDFDGDDRISIADLTSALAGTLREHNIVISRVDIDAIVVNTMREAIVAEEGFMSYAEFKSLVSKRPQMLDCLNINISKIIDDYARLDGVSFATPRLGYGS